MRDTYQLSHLHGYLQALTVFAVDIGPHMHMDIGLVAEALRTYFLSKVSLSDPSISGAQPNKHIAKQGLHAGCEQGSG